MSSGRSVMDVTLSVIVKSQLDQSSVWESKCEAIIIRNLQEDMCTVTAALCLDPVNRSCQMTLRAVAGQEWVTLGTKRAITVPA